MCIYNKGGGGVKGGGGLRGGGGGYGITINEERNFPFTVSR